MSYWHQDVSLKVGLQPEHQSKLSKDPLALVSSCKSSSSCESWRTLKYNICCFKRVPAHLESNPEMTEIHVFLDKQHLCLARVQFQ